MLEVKSANALTWPFNIDVVPSEVLCDIDQAPELSKQRTWRSTREDRRGDIR